MKIAIIVAVSANNVIGVSGRLPWHLPEDLKRFRELTMGKPIIMGRATFESIGRPLPGRENIVLTRDLEYVAEGCVIAQNTEVALAIAQGAREVMIIGGGEVYRQFLPTADKIYLTRVEVEVQGDTTFPVIDMSIWTEVSKEQYKSHGVHEPFFEITTLERI